jgi:hypothetical protein
MTNESFDSARNIAILILPKSGSVTEEQIADAVDRAAELKDLSSYEVKQLKRDLEAAYTVTVDQAFALDGDGDHVEWLADRRPAIEWNLWRRYMRYLMESKNFSPPVANRLDEDTDRILQRLEDPQRQGAWDRRGMVVGHVQSGKTANYTGLICKAFDAGYKVVVVLAGIDDGLRSQTQLRIDEGVLGFDTQKQRNFDQDNSRIGVGLLRGEPLYAVNSLTSSAPKGDFRRVFAQTIGVNPGGNDPLILVVKKNKSILNNLTSWITSFDAIKDDTGRKIVYGVPLLVIDDECDNASVNTNIEDPEVSPTAINGCIRELLASFDQSAYIGYTATPFANIFISPDSGNLEKHGENLFPRDFIVSLKRASNYVGAAKVFGIAGDDEVGIEAIDALPITRTVDDQEEWILPSHKNGHHVPSPMPSSLREALLSFILVCAARRARRQITSHNSMLVHVTRFTNVQAQVSLQIEEELGYIKQRIKYGDGARSPGILDELRELWESDFLPTTAKFDDPSLQEVTWIDLEEHLESAATKIEVRTINGTSGDSLEYFNKPSGVSVIAVGGAKLSRGLTLEGLSISYYLRTSRMYDTLLQMGRWFGFRPGYLDLCRLYTTAELQRWYRETALANEDLLVQFDEMALTGKTPADFGLRVRQSPEGLAVTRAGAMRNGTKIRLTFSGSITETILFDPTERAVNANLHAVEGLVHAMEEHAPPTRLGSGELSNLVWAGIAGEDVADFLEQYSSHPQATKAQSSLMAKYIRSRLSDSSPELVEWTVAILSNPETVAEIAGYKVGRTKRSHFPSDKESSDIYAIRRLLNPADERIDLSPEEAQQAELLTQEWWEKGLLTSKSGEPPSTANGRAVRACRPPTRGLLLIYALDEAESTNTALTTPIMGIALSFPHSAATNAGAMEYVVNPVYWKSEQELE